MPAAYLMAPPAAGVPTPYESGCTGKLRQTRRQAMSTKHRRVAINGRPGGAYQCRWCGWWHSTHAPGWRFVDRGLVKEEVR